MHVLDPKVNPLQMPLQGELATQQQEVQLAKRLQLFHTWESASDAESGLTQSGSFPRLTGLVTDGAKWEYEGQATSD